GGGEWFHTKWWGRWRRDERDGAHTRLAGRPKVRTVAIQAIRHNILAGQHPRVMQVADHSRGHLGFALPDDLVRHLTFGPPDLVGLGEPRLRQEQPFVHQGIALARGIGGEDPYPAMLHLPYGAAVWAGGPPRASALLQT